ncbi:hypothetical protein ACFLTH_15590 [Bacteroidota bacterium]
MKLKRFIMLLVVVLLLSATATLLYYSYFKAEEVVDIEWAPYSFHISNHVGLVGDRDAVKFGGIMPGGSGERGINVSNDFDFPVKIRITTKGEKSDWITIKENNFILEPHTSKEVKLRVNIPATAVIPDTKINHTGTVTAYYIRI